jgi:hypothetical protein
MAGAVSPVTLSFIIIIIIANVVGKDLDIFALGAVSLNYIYAPNCK